MIWSFVDASECILRDDDADSKDSDSLENSSVHSLVVEDDMR